MTMGKLNNIHTPHQTKMVHIMNTSVNPSLAAATPALRQIHDLPGPRGLPFVGNALQLTPSRIHQDIEQAVKRYGPYFQMQFGARKVLVVAEHAVIAGVLRDRPERFRRSERTAQISHEIGLKVGVFFAEGETWKQQRRMVMASFAARHVKAYFPSLLKVTQRLQARWQTAARSNAEIDLQGDLMRYTVDAISGLAFGADVNTLESDDDIIQRHLDKIFPALNKRIFGAFPYWRYIKLPADRQLARSVAEVGSAIEKFIATARTRLNDDPERRENPRNLLEAMLVAADEAGSGIDDQMVVGNVQTMLLAGEDTTANTLAWMIYLLQQNPQALQRAQEEVRRLAPDPAAYTPEKMGELHYLEACTHETMRLKPVAPFMPVQALQDCIVADIHVPKDTLIWCVLRHDSVDDKYFPNAQHFDPQRWLGDEAGSASKRIAMPFGSGPRICPGRYLALLEIKLAMAMLLSRFDILAVDTPNGGEAQELMSFTMCPVGLRMRLQARSDLADQVNH